MDRLASLVIAVAAAAFVAAAAPGFARQTDGRPTGAAPAAATARDAALRALAARLELPLVDEAVAIFSTQLRRTLPTYFVTAAGRQLGLGPRFARGDPSFDETLRQVDAALAAEERRGGPLLKLERGDLLYAVDIRWTRDDIAFVDDTLDTPLGREASRAIDARAAQQVIATLSRRVALGAAGNDVRQALADLDERARSQFADASLMLLASRATDPERTGRLQRLLASVTVAPSDAIGERVVDRLSRRLLDAAAAQLPNLLGVVAGFRTGP